MQPSQLLRSARHGQHAVAASERSAMRAVAMPSEHGGWSLSFEPVLLGLLVAWSWSGVALGAAAMLAFLARTPLKLVLVDRWRRRWLPRTALAARVALVELVAMAALVVVAAAGAERRFWGPLLVAAPLVAVELWFDMRSRGRRLAPELAGTVGIGAAAAAIALAGGTATSVAIGLWAVVAARAVASIPYARTQVFRGRGTTAPTWPSDLAQGVAVIGVMVGWVLDTVPTASVIVIAAGALFNTVAVRAAPRPAKVIGMQQLCFGLAVVAVTAIAVRV
jgi:hypothetical protein